MYIGIIYSTEKKVIEKIAEALKSGLEAQGGIVKMFPDTSKNFVGLASCKHIFVGTFVTSAFKAKTPQRLKDTLSKAPGISGKRSIAFVVKSGMGEKKALLSLMDDMEKQGCFIIDQQSFASEKEAFQFGKSVNFK